MRGALAAPLTSRRAADLLSQVVDGSPHTEPATYLPEAKEDESNSKELKAQELELNSQSQVTVGPQLHHSESAALQRGVNDELTTTRRLLFQLSESRPGRRNLSRSHQQIARKYHNMTNGLSTLSSQR